LARLGLVIVPSRAMAEFLASVGLPADRIEVVYPGIEAFASRPASSHDAFVVGTAGQLEPWKGIDLLLDAAARVPEPLRIEIFGDGSQRSDLEKRAAALGVHAIFHGRVSDVRDRLATLDAFVHPSRAENLPTSILEAMASSLPVVATRVGGVPEAVIDGVTGFVVEPDDPGAMASAIVRLMRDPGRRAAMGLAGAARVADTFDPGRAARRTVAIYERVCASSR
jgi:glycosyltransferase involved in cell wall biosynthesis